jgi:hypothetical protein
MSSNPTKEVYNKMGNILRAIEQCSCQHCLSILKNGLGNPTPNPDDNADINNPKDQSGVAYTSE